MPADLVRRINLDLIWPDLTPRLLELVARCRAKGADYYAIDGFRSFADQQQKYNIGRVVLTDARGVKLRPITNARPGESAHNFGLAVDFCRDSDLGQDGLQPDWKVEDYQLLADEAKAMGLDPAFYWTSFKEGPHVQLNLKAKGVEMAELKRVFLQREQLQDVWDFLALRGPW